IATRIVTNGPGDRFGIREGDVIERIQGAEVRTAQDVASKLGRIGAWGKAEYTIRRGGVDVPVTLIIGEAARGFALSYQYLVGIAYLVIGLFIYFRRGSAYKAQHFYVFCLVSFIYSCFHYTGKLNAFDQVIYWGNVIAGWLA